LFGPATGFSRKPPRRLRSQVFLRRPEMPQGKIKRLVSDRGFGFVEGERDDLFFHHSEVQGVAFEELREGQMVEYNIGQGRKGPCATGVRLAEKK
jgi:CspA family cold shock protein